MTDQQHSSDTERPNCCEASFTALTTYLNAQAVLLDITYPAGPTGANSQAILQNEAANLLASTQTALTTLLNDNCKCDCCVAPAQAIVAANLSALTQTSAAVATLLTNGAGQNTAFVGSVPSPAPVVVPAGSTTTGFVNVAASLAAFQATVPPPTPSAIAAYKAALLAYRSTLQANIEDAIVAPAAASVAATLAYFACPPQCEPEQCYRAERKEESSSSTVPPLRTHKPRHGQEHAPAPHGAQGPAEQRHHKKDCKKCGK